jgi:hypothetical protein
LPERQNFVVLCPQGSNNFRYGTACCYRDCPRTAQEIRKAFKVPIAKANPCLPILYSVAAHSAAAQEKCVIKQKTGAVFARDSVKNAQRFPFGNQPPQFPVGFFVS